MDYNKKINELFSKLREDKADFTYKEFDEEIEKLSAEYQSEQYADYRIKVNFINKSTNKNPEYQTNGSSGFDIRANLETPYILKPGERCLIPTGLFFELPANFEMQIRPRSGLAINYGITVLNTPATIDNDYTGEIKIILINLGKEDFTINHGDRIAQGIFSTIISKNHINFIQMSEIKSNADRGDRGFGSTGLV